MSKTINLTRGEVAIVDDCDFDSLNIHKWYCHISSKGSKYASRIDSNRKNISIHREIMLPKEGEEVDHIDLNGLNNTRNNLRICNRSENNRNRRTFTTNTSGFKGVHWHSENRRWQALIRFNGKRIHLGYYDTPEGAHEAYKSAAEKYHGEFRRI